MEKRFIGITDVDLDPVGVFQARYWEQALAPIRLDTIYSSRLMRCRNTAELIAKDRTVIQTRALNEINMGSWDGKPFDLIKTQYPEEFEKRGQALDTFKPPGAESFEDVSHRVIPFINNLTRSPGKKILIVTHAGVIRTILCHFLNLELKDLFQIQVSYGELFLLQKYKI